MANELTPKLVELISKFGIGVGNPLDKPIELCLVFALKLKFKELFRTTFPLFRITYTMPLKSKIKSIVPRPAFFRARHLYQNSRLRASGIRQVFEMAPSSPEFLPLNTLSKLASEFTPKLEDTVQAAYSEDAMELRAEARLAELKRVLGSNFDSAVTFMETGAADGMVSRALQLTGKQATTCDIYTGCLDPRANKAGVKFIKSSASNLNIDNNSFDVLFSYDSFEHFDKPDLALKESIRVVKPGGYIYMRFGPLYHSRDGMHLGSRLGIPYAPILYKKATIDDFMISQGRDPINHDYCNQWSLAAYRKLFTKFHDQLDMLEYYELWDTSAIGLIRRYPSCFRSKTNSLDEYLVAIIEVLFRKPL